MPVTFPNQNIVIVKKSPCKNNFLQVNNEEWMQASKDCGKSFNAFKLWLYLAANEIGYEKALSPVAVEKVLDMKKTSYYDSIEKLREKGYLVDIGGNKLAFYTTPFNSDEKEEKDQNSVEAESHTSNFKNVSFSAQTEGDALDRSNGKLYNGFEF